MKSIEEILLNFGYDLKNDGSRFWRAYPIYRESSNASSLRIAKDTGSFIDFSANVKGSFHELVRLSLGVKTIKEASKWMEEQEYEYKFIERKPKISVDKPIKKKYIENLMPHFSFYENRGISLETIKLFECGVCFSGKQNNRLVFVIRDENQEVCGVIGRDLVGGRVKWKKLGDSRKWIFPLISIPYIEEEREVFLVESIGDMLSLYEIGIKNVIVLFGVELSNKLLNFLSTLGLKKIYISTNNDSTKEKNWGAIAAENIKNKLLKVIDENVINISLPPSGDWNEIEKEERKKYVQEIRNRK